MARYDGNFGRGSRGRSGGGYGARDYGFRGGFGAERSRYDSGYAAGRGGYDRGFGRGRRDASFDGGWGMTGLFNEVMRGGPAGANRYDREIRTRPLSDEGRRRPVRGIRSRDRDTADRGSVGVHLRGRYDGF